MRPLLHMRDEAQGDATPALRLRAGDTRESLRSLQPLRAASRVSYYRSVTIPERRRTRAANWAMHRKSSTLEGAGTIKVGVRAAWAKTRLRSEHDPCVIVGVLALGFLAGYASSASLVYFQGHWISRQLSDVIALSLFLWPVCLVCGAGARHSGDASSDARQRSGTN